MIAKVIVGNIVDWLVLQVVKNSVSGFAESDQFWSMLRDETECCAARYELWCIARTVATRYCLLNCDVPAERARAWNDARREASAPCYSAAVFEDLVRRFEAPSTRNRWDMPLFTARPGAEPTPRLRGATCEGSNAESSACATRANGAKPGAQATAWRRNTTGAAALHDSRSTVCSTRAESREPGARTTAWLRAVSGDGSGGGSRPTNTVGSIRAAGGIEEPGRAADAAQGPARSSQWAPGPDECCGGPCKAGIASPGAGSSGEGLPRIPACDAGTGGVCPAGARSTGRALEGQTSHDGGCGELWAESGNAKKVTDDGERTTLGSDACEADATRVCSAEQRSCTGVGEFQSGPSGGAGAKGLGCVAAVAGTSSFRAAKERSYEDALEGPSRSAGAEGLGLGASVEAGICSVCVTEERSSGGVHEGQSGLGGGGEGNGCVAARVAQGQDLPSSGSVDDDRGLHAVLEVRRAPQRFHSPARLAQGQDLPSSGSVDDDRGLHAVLEVRRAPQRFHSPAK